VYVQLFQLRYRYPTTVWPLVIGGRRRTWATHHLRNQSIGKAATCWYRYQPSDCTHEQHPWRGINQADKPKKPRTVKDGHFHSRYSRTGTRHEGFFRVPRVDADEGTDVDPPGYLHVMRIPGVHNPTQKVPTSSADDIPWIELDRHCGVVCHPGLSREGDTLSSSPTL
jgi:hypothetical protein